MKKAVVLTFFLFIVISFTASAQVSFPIKQVSCENIVGGFDLDYCTDSSGTGITTINNITNNITTNITNNITQQIGGFIEAGNVSTGTFGANTGGGDYVFSSASVTDLFRITSASDEVIFNDAGDVDATMRWESDSLDDFLFYDSSNRSGRGCISFGDKNGCMYSTILEFFEAFGDNILIVRDGSNSIVTQLTSVGDLGLGGLAVAGKGLSINVSTSFDGIVLYSISTANTVASLVRGNADDFGELYINTASGSTAVRISGGQETVFNDQQEQFDFRIEGNSNPDVFFVNSSTDRIGIKTTAPLGDLDISNSGSSTISFVSSYGTGIQSSQVLYTPRGTETTPLANNVSDVLGQIGFQGWDTARSNGAIVKAVAAGDWGNSGNDNPTNITFQTVADGSGTLTDRMTIASTGHVDFFSSANAVSNVTVTGEQFKQLQNNQSSTVATTYVNMVNLSLTLLANTYYSVHCDIITDAAVVTTGVQLRVNTTGSPSQVRAVYTSMSSASAMESFTGTNTASNAFADAGSNTVASIGYIDMFVRTSGSASTVTFEMRSEVGTSLAHVREGSFCWSKKVVP